MRRLRMAGHSADEIRSWLNELLRLTDWKPSRLAHEAGLAPSTLNRFLRGGPTARAVATLPDGRLMVSGPNKAYEAYTVKPGRLEILGRIAGMWRTLSSYVATAVLPFIG